MEDMIALKKALGALGAESSEQVLKKFRTYIDGVLRWNQKVNLTTITDPEDFVVKHFID